MRVVASKESVFNHWKLLQFLFRFSFFLWKFIKIKKEEVEREKNQQNVQ